MTRIGSGLTAVLLASTCLAGGAWAQSATSPLTPPPTFRTVDERGIDLFSGELTFSDDLLSIGQSGGVGLAQTHMADFSDHAYLGTITSSYDDRTGVTTYTVSFSGMSETFTNALFQTTYVSRQRRGSTLELNGDVYNYVKADGSRLEFSKAYGGYGASATTVARLTSATLPTGEVIRLNYKIGVTKWSQIPSINLTYVRVQSVTSSRGYQIKYKYASGALPTASNEAQIRAFTDPNGYQAINNAIEYCDPAADSCSTSLPWPAVSISGGAITDPVGRVTTYNIVTGGNVTSTIVRPSGETVTIVRDAYGRVASWSNGTGTWTYAYADGVNRTTTVTDPLGHQKVVVSTLGAEPASAGPAIVSVRDGLNRTTSYVNDSFNRITQITFPEGDAEQYAYDDRGNITQVTKVSKPGSGLASVVLAAGFDTACANPKTCNQANWTRDGLGRQTDYTYDPTHGGLLTVTAPAPMAGAARPQTSYSYVQTPTYAKNASGVLVQAGAIWSVSQISACSINTTCAGVAEESRTTISYAGDHNGLPTSVMTGSGDGALTATTSTVYDSVGNSVAVDGPLAGTADTTRYRYSAAREVLGTVAPDPDGGGPLKHRAVRNTYDAGGRLAIIEEGALSGQADADWSGMVVLRQELTRYDVHGQPTHQAISSGGAIQSVTQFSYDAVGRPQCRATRMNMAAVGAWPDFAALPASACALGTQGAEGPDRITLSLYDAADQLTQTTSAYGTTDARTDVALTYTADGDVATATDGKGGLTTYGYDGFDRLSSVRYPNVSGGGSSTSDFEQYTYDAADNITQQRRRDGATVNYAFDALNRVTYHDGVQTWYYYDNLDRTTYVYAGDSAERAVGQYYDGLGRASYSYELRNGSWQATYTGYDLAGRRTLLQWPDGFSVNYDHNVAGDLTAIRENGATTLATYAYDDLGRRVSVTRGDGSSSIYSYDSAGRLGTLSLDLPGGAYDDVHGFTYSAAGQLKDRTGANDLYRWSSGAAVSRTYVIDGLNRIASTNGVGLTYDGRGNLTGDGAVSYGYDVGNRLVSTSTGAGLTYDPIGRLSRIAASTTTQLSYSGADLVGEFDASGALLRRYVPGPEADEPVVWYEGSGTGDRRYLVSDERGSVVAVASAGGAVSINTYDEYGVPGAGNVGRYGFTGQAFISEAGVYNFKARIYSPTLGRFLQADPIGYGDGMNLYAYAGADPINGWDGSGLGGSTEGVNEPNLVEELVVMARRAADTVARVSIPQDVTHLSELVVTAARKKPAGRINGVRGLKTACSRGAGDVFDNTLAGAARLLTTPFGENATLGVRDAVVWNNVQVTYGMAIMPGKSGPGTGFSFITVAGVLPQNGKFGFRSEAFISSRPPLSPTMQAGFNRGMFGVSGNTGTVTVAMTPIRLGKASGGAVNVQSRATVRVSCGVF